MIDQYKLSFPPNTSLIGIQAKALNCLRQLPALPKNPRGAAELSTPRELELELILSQMAQKPMLRGEVGARRENGVWVSYMVVAALVIWVSALPRTGLPNQPFCCGVSLSRSHGTFRGHLRCPLTP